MNALVIGGVPVRVRALRELSQEASGGLRSTVSGQLRDDSLWRRRVLEVDALAVGDAELGALEAVIGPDVDVACSGSVIGSLTARVVFASPREPVRVAGGLAHFFTLLIREQLS